MLNKREILAIEVLMIQAATSIEDCVKVSFAHILSRSLST
jgi:hypothetical protein